HRGETREHDEDGQHGRKNGPVDEKAREHGTAYFLGSGFCGPCGCAAGFAALAEFASAMRTGAPGPRRIKPSTITLSPGCTPLRMIQASPAQSPTSSGRGCAVPFSSTM